MVTDHHKRVAKRPAAREPAEVLRKAGGGLGCRDPAARCRLSKRGGKLVAKCQGYALSVSSRQLSDCFGRLNSG